eukprot:TRINITY_DN2113_c0_g1_i1.p1 TRINITY_DN2113_c0_g1~~TRINITY_DN2113_c0_g1_i1.p1  ORF type:complete len:483 (+),score=113.78 TRINITY_DN2113_c0_g1_i1:58-1506(+)
MLGKTLSLLLLFFSAIYCDTARIKSLTSINAINNIKDALTPVIESQIQGLKFPPVSGSKDGVHYNIDNMVLSSFNFGPSTVYLSQGLVEIVLPSVSAQLDSDWSYKFLLIHGSGSANDYINLELVVTLNIGASGGKPTISVGSLNVVITNLDIKVHGGASWFYQFFVDLFKSEIENIFTNVLQSQLTQVINKMGNSLVQGMPTTLTIDNAITVDYSILSPPDIQNDFSALSHLGDIEWAPNPSPCPLFSAELPEAIMQNKLLTFVISQSVADCLGNVFYEQGKLGGTIYPNMVPKGSPVQLNTANSLFVNAIPALNQIYPNSGIALNVYATQVPDFYINGTANYIEADVSGLVVVEVDLNNTGNYIEVFTLGIQLQNFATFTVDSTNNHLIGKISQIKFNVNVNNTNVGPIDLKHINVLITFLIDLGIQPIINQKLAEGFPLPEISGVQLENPVIVNGDGYLQVGTDFIYNPSVVEELMMTE